MSTSSLYQMVIPVRHGLPQTLVNAFSSPDGTLGVSADRVKIAQGRMFHPRARGEAVIDPQLAALEHLRPGSTLHLLGVPDNPTTGRPELQLAVPLAFRVSAVVVFDTQIVPATTTDGEPVALLSPSFSHPRGGEVLLWGPGRGPPAAGCEHGGFLRAATTLAKRYPATGNLLAVNLADEVTATGGPSARKLSRWAFSPGWPA